MDRERTKELIEDAASGEPVGSAEVLAATSEVGIRPEDLHSAAARATHGVLEPTLSQILAERALEVAPSSALVDRIEAVLGARYGGTVTRRRVGDAEQVQVALGELGRSLTVSLLPEASGSRLVLRMDKVVDWSAAFIAIAVNVTGGVIACVSIIAGQPWMAGLGFALIPLSGVVHARMNKRARDSAAESLLALADSLELALHPVPSPP